MPSSINELSLRGFADGLTSPAADSAETGGVCATGTTARSDNGFRSSTLTPVSTRWDGATTGSGRGVAMVVVVTTRCSWL
ncbi:hypothetical protein OGAPHI_003394 [Ogataea philodendri]|uniref:Uncharacterized protein n=1 Tax=Ogataea philodendri TaxID=1378263 RepID=A0A9P8P943_9ASCO|nr:uncharacterized protein OGAPHI_003394 [Ogataea philodendri]KAH3666944.1 hypothetical protein OGAPHI_003394 [Ogataea philodendri]